MALPAAASEIAGAFSDIPEVESVYLAQDDHVLSVCIFVNQEDDSAYDKIYDREIELERNAGQRSSFDFRIIARRNRPIQEFVGMTPPAWVRFAKAGGTH